MSNSSSSSCTRRLFLSESSVGYTECTNVQDGIDTVFGFKLEPSNVYKLASYRESARVNKIGDIIVMVPISAYGENKRIELAYNEAKKRGGIRAVMNMESPKKMTIQCYNVYSLIGNIFQETLNDAKIPTRLEDLNLRGQHRSNDSKLINIKFRQSDLFDGLPAIMSPDLVKDIIKRAIDMNVFPITRTFNQLMTLHRLSNPSLPDNFDDLVRRWYNIMVNVNKRLLDASDINTVNLLININKIIKGVELYISNWSNIDSRYNTTLNSRKNVIDLDTSKEMEAVLLAQLESDSNELHSPILELVRNPSGEFYKLYGSIGSPWLIDNLYSSLNDFETKVATTMTFEDPADFALIRERIIPDIRKIIDMKILVMFLTDGSIRDVISQVFINNRITREIYISNFSRLLHFARKEVYNFRSRMLYNIYQLIDRH